MSCFSAAAFRAMQLRCRQTNQPTVQPERSLGSQEGPFQKVRAEKVMLEYQGCTENP